MVYYAKVLAIDRTKRISLFPGEPEHKNAQKDYYQFRLEEIQKLPRPIPSRRWRRIVHIPTSVEKLFNAREINDLYDTSPLEDKMYQEMKRREIQAERQLFIEVGDQNYCLETIERTIRNLGGLVKNDFYLENI